MLWDLDCPGGHVGVGWALRAGRAKGKGQNPVGLSQACSLTPGREGVRAPDLPTNPTHTAPCGSWDRDTNTPWAELSDCSS